MLCNIYECFKKDGFRNAHYFWNAYFNALKHQTNAGK